MTTRASEDRAAGEHGELAFETPELASIIFAQGLAPPLEVRPERGVVDGRVRVARVESAKTEGNYDSSRLSRLEMGVTGAANADSTFRPDL